MECETMIESLLMLTGGSALLAAVAVLVCQLVFPDVLPYAIDENAQLAWRREAAFLVTTIAWLAVEVSVVSAIGLAIILWKDRLTKMR
jgi:predicted membrane-bound dolichyl-phosphate-mannose-protein mannosyltransferase